MLVFIVILASNLLMSANSDSVVDVSNKTEYMIVAIKKPTVKDGFGFIEAKRTDGWSGVVLDENIKLNIDDEKLCFSSSTVGYRFFVSKKYRGSGYQCVFEVYQKTNDSFGSVKKFVNDKELQLYTNDYSRGVIWIPASCENNVKECQSDLDYLRDRKMILEKRQ
ncbi:hypothetical protein [Thiolapillus sp.]|uniref:hypothetical protein n=1 Tax=Thiolapillus sp. TaxID=2017437 RepID=UPI003AF46A57